VLLSVGRSAEAKQIFEQAVELHPQSDVASLALKLASRQLGQGDNSSLKTPLAPVEIPPVVKTAIADAGIRPAAHAQQNGDEELLRVVGFSYEPEKPLRKTTVRRVKILTPSAVSRFNSLSFKIDPVGERLYVNQLVVSDEHGQPVATGSVESYYLVDDTS